MKTIDELQKELKRVIVYNGYRIPEYGSMNKIEIIDMLLDEILILSKMYVV